jgi:hypothetical protein
MDYIRHHYGDISFQPSKNDSTVHSHRPRDPAFNKKVLHYYSQIIVYGHRISKKRRKSDFFNFEEFHVSHIHFFCSICLSCTYKNTEFHKLLTMDDPLCECKIFPRSNDPKLRGVQTASDIPFSCVDTKLSSFTFEERFWKVLCTYMYTVLAL